MDSTETELRMSFWMLGYSVQDFFILCFQIYICWWGRIGICRRQLSFVGSSQRNCKDGILNETTCNKTIRKHGKGIYHSIRKETMFSKTYYCIGVFQKPSYIVSFHWAKVKIWLNSCRASLFTIQGHAFVTRKHITSNLLSKKAWKQIWEANLNQLSILILHWLS